MRNWPYPRVVAHRGAGNFAPENTIAAMKKGLEFGYRAVEFDVMLTSDLVPVLMHDPQLGRTVSARGGVADTASSALLKMDAGSWFSAEYTGELVPLYRDVVRFCRDNEIWMNVEIKPAPGHAWATGEVVAEVTKSMFVDEPNPAHWPLFSSFEADSLKAAHATAPEIARCLLTDKRVPDDWAERLSALRCVAIDCNHLYLEPLTVAAIKKEGYGVCAYTIDTLERARQVFGWGVDALCTDRPDLIPADLKL